MYKDGIGYRWILFLVRYGSRVYYVVGEVGLI